VQKVLLCETTPAMLSAACLPVIEALQRRRVMVTGVLFKA